MPLPLPLPRLLSVHPIPGEGGRRGGLLSIVANTRKGVPFSRVVVVVNLLNLQPVALPI